MPVQEIPDEVESVRSNENSEKSSKFTYHKKDANIETSQYGSVLNALKKLDTSYNPKMTKIHKPDINGNYKLTGDTRVILIVEKKDEEIQWKDSTSIYMNDGDPETLTEAMTRPNVHLWEMLRISEVNNFLSRKAEVLMKISVGQYKGRNSVPVKWIFKSK